jgi:hypothetical protein
VRCQLNAPAVLPPPPPLDRRLGGLQSRSGRYGEIKILHIVRTRTPTPPSSRTYNSQRNELPSLELYTPITNVRINIYRCPLITGGHPLVHFRIISHVHRKVVAACKDRKIGSECDCGAPDSTTSDFSQVPHFRNSNGESPRAYLIPNSISCN